MRILIVGGGIAGLTLAIALRKSEHELTLVEAAPEWSAIGSGIGIGPNAMAALARIGVNVDGFLAKGAAVNGWDLYSKHLLIHQFDLLPLQRIFGYPLVCATRTDLLDSLLAELGDVRIRLALRATRLKQDADAVTVGFSDGDEARYDLVVGADGISSFVRRATFGVADLRYSGTISYRSIVHGMPDMDRMFEIWGEGKRIGQSPVGNNSHYFYASLVAPQRMASISPAESLALFQETFRDIGQPFEEAFSKITSPEQLILTPINELVNHPWHDGRVVLIGDAGHALTPNLGQGGAMAIEDAVTLADLLEEEEEELATVFSRYEEARRVRVSSVQDRSRAFGTIAHTLGEQGTDDLLKTYGGEFLDNLVRI